MYSNKISHAPNAARGHILTQAKYLEIHRIQFYFTGGGNYIIMFVAFYVNLQMPIKLFALLTWRLPKLFIEMYFPPHREQNPCQL